MQHNIDKNIFSLYTGARAMDQDILDTQAQHVQRGGVPNLLALAFLLSESKKLSQIPLNIICDQVKEIETLSTLLTAFTQKTIYTLSPASQDVWNALHLKPGDILVSQYLAATEPILPTRQKAAAQTYTIQVHNPIEIRALISWCTQHGYQRNTTAHLPWTFAHRGEVFDVWTDAPTRIVCDNDLVQEIYTFDLETGQRIKTLQSIALLPQHFNGSSTLLDLLPTNTIVITWNCSIETTLQHININALSYEERGSISLTRLPSYQHRIDKLLEQIHDDTTITIVSSHPDRIAGMLPHKKARIINSNTDLEGFYDTVRNHICLTDHTIGGAPQETKTKKRSKKKSQLLMSLKPGDYAVHMFHGIGKFTGMTEMKVNDIMHEYFVLEFAKGDKIYVPVQLADYLDTYVGDPHPKLSKLADASWSEVVARVKAQALDMARDLLHTYARRSIAQAPILNPVDEESQLQALCEFALTKDQETALADIFADCQKSLPMDRLLCGDVGFGKTELALRLAFRAALHNQQVALLAPTTVLTQQHLDTFTERLNTFGIQVAALSRFQSPEEQKVTLRKIADGTVDIVIGTHRLLSKDVHWKSLGVIIIDEEQRFGVKAKEGLQQHRSHAHVLTMTATPIPRTLNLSLSGIRDISTILTAPLQRKVVEMTIERFDIHIIQHAIKREMNRGGQLYYIYNRVQGIELKKQELEALFPHIRIGIAHGQMDEESLSRVMHAFDTGQIDVLLATTIVENGLDIPRANTIIVEHATQFGLADLYQLKGRVGRSSIQGYALFLYAEQRLDHDALKRLTALQETDMLGAGFELALRDMEIRGVGNILGKDQHGHAVKIGLNLYGRLLHQAVAELEGNPEAPMRDIPIDLPLEARIPETLFPSMEERITLYQELANIADPDDLRLRKHTYQHLPIEFAGLFDLLEIKLLASRSPLLAIDTTHPSTHNQLTSPRITLTSEKPFTQLPHGWELVYTKNGGGYRARTTCTDLGPDWIAALKKYISILSS